MLTQALLIYDTLRHSATTVADGVLGRIDREVIDARIRQWGADCVRHAGLSIEVEGRDAIDWARSYIVMTNHQSYLDIPVVAVTVPGGIRFIAKKELFRIPLFGPAMKAAGIIRIDRQNREAAIASLREAADVLKGGGRHIWIAPEGTRSRDGKLGTLKKGGFVLAVDAGAPILPAAVLGTRQAMRPKDGWRIHRGVSARVVFGPPVEVGGRSREQLMAEVEGFLRAQIA